jgi:nitrous oxide reductase accessory protein NosL
MGYRSLFAAAVAALVLAGCGSSSSGQSSGPRSWTIQQFLRLSGLQRSADGLSYSLPDHPQCVARILLRSNAEVQTYENAGDVVATNADKSAGVRVEALAHLK